MVAQENSWPGPRTHIDVLIDRFPAPDVVDAAEATIINTAHTQAIAKAISDGLCLDYKLEDFRLNRDIRIPVKTNMRDEPGDHQVEFAPWSFYRMAKQVILSHENERVTYQLLGIKVGDTPETAAGGRVDTAGLFSSPVTTTRPRCRCSFACEGAPGPSHISSSTSPPTFEAMDAALASLQRADDKLHAPPVEIFDLTDATLADLHKTPDPHSINLQGSIEGNICRHSLRDEARQRLRRRTRI
eukprot:SAG31_NODE_8845_length_1376_cov_2.115897_2_plen_243_part_00